MADTEPDFVMQTYIHCTLDALWAAPTDPEEIARYRFLTDIVRREGDTLIYDFAPGQRMMDNRIVALEPRTRIEQTFEGHWEGAGAPSRFVYHLREEGPACALTLEHYALEFPVSHGEGVADGWARQLAGLKTYLEAGRPVRYSHAGTGA
ncbi:MAG: SRPBCC domain-containing protein [Shimia sp.]